ncbi:Uncharacterized protein FWK35_00032605, partial [Aphis craccivora]
MMCVFFFVSVYSITSRNNAPISNYRGGFRCKSKYPWLGQKLTFSHSFKKNRKKQKKKNDGKTGMTKNSNFYEICRKRENL